jgi:hypothetical protein
VSAAVTLTAARTTVTLLLSGDASERRNLFPLVGGVFAMLDACLATPVETRDEDILTEGVDALQTL